jgi:hypothetical protein
MEVAAVCVVLAAFLAATVTRRAASLAARALSVTSPASFSISRRRRNSDKDSVPEASFVIKMSWYFSERDAALIVIVFALKGFFAGFPLVESPRRGIASLGCFNPGILLTPGISGIHHRCKSCQ